MLAGKSRAAAKSALFPGSSKRYKAVDQPFLDVPKGPCADGF